jgi:hypothetical protein
MAPPPSTGSAVVYAPRARGWHDSASNRDAWGIGLAGLPDDRGAQRILADDEAASLSPPLTGSIINSGGCRGARGHWRAASQPVRLRVEDLQIILYGRS